MKKAHQKSRGALERDRLYHYAKGVGGSDQKEPGQPAVEGTTTTASETDGPASAHLPEEDG